MVKIPLRANGALNTALLKKEREKLIELFPSLAHLPIPQIAWHAANDVTEIPVCRCGNPLKFKGFGKGYAALCTPECESRADHFAHVMMRNHGVSNSFQLDHAKKKSKQTCLERYGVEHFSKTSEFSERAKKTNLARRGVEWPTQSEVVIQKRQAANLEKYGVKEPSQLEHVKGKIVNTNKSRYGANSFTQSVSGRDRLKASLKKHHDEKNPNRHLLEDVDFVMSRYSALGSLTLLAKELKLNLNYLSRWFASNGFEVVHPTTSSINVEVAEFVKSLGCEVSVNNRQLIKPYELDVVAGKLAIELNGLYWHSFDRLETPEEKNRHLMKLELAQAAGLDLIQFTDAEWRDKQEIVKSIIRSRLGVCRKIYARKTQVVELSQAEAREFLNANHIQGHVNARVNLGLKLDGELVAVMTFSPPRFNRAHTWELIRFANVLNTTVIGGAAKLLKHFRLQNEGSILSYSDRMKFTGNLYESLGFKLERVNGPAYHYTDKKQLMSRVKFQKHKLPKLLENFDPNLTEAENCFRHGLMRYWDCGTITWTMT